MESSAKDFRTKIVLRNRNNTCTDPKEMAEADTAHLKLVSFSTDSQSPLFSMATENTRINKKISPILRVDRSNSTSEESTCTEYSDCMTSCDEFTNNLAFVSKPHLTNINSDTLEKSDLNGLIKNNMPLKHWCEIKASIIESSEKNCPKSKWGLNYSEKSYSIFHNEDFLTLNSLRKIESDFKKLDFCDLSFPKSNKLPLIFLDCFDKFKDKDLSKTHFEKGLCLSMLSNKRKCGIIDYEGEFEQKIINKLSSNFSRNKYSTCVRPYHFFKRSYATDLMKFYNKSYFPTQSKNNLFESSSSKQETTCLDNASFQVFTKNRGLREACFKVMWRQNILLRAKPNNLDKNRPASNDFLVSNETGDSDEGFLDTPKNALKCDINERGLSVALKLAEVRQQVRKLHYKTHTEMDRRYHQHQQFIQECRRICDSAISFSDFDVLLATHDNVKRKADITTSASPVILQSPDHLRNQNNRETSAASNSYLKMIGKLAHQIPYLYVTVPVCLALGVRFASTIIGQNISVLCYF